MIMNNATNQPSNQPSDSTAARFAVALAMAWAVATGSVWAQDSGKKDFSPAERLLLMADQLGHLKPPLQLVYDFKHTGTLEAAFDELSGK
mgnify:CR=1 FL=1